MGTYSGMIAGNIIRIVGPMAVTVLGLGTSSLVSPTASAQPCPDAQVVFARGTGEPEGVGPTGQAFIDNLRGREAGKSVDVYAVNYPASNEWNTGLDGIRDAGAHIVSMANECPKTKMVLGGFSQGAAVMGFVTSAQVPDGVDPATVPKPLAPEIADHVAAVVLFGTPNVRAMNFLGEPPVVIGPTYQAKTIKVCATDDPVCSDGMNFAAHNTYADGGAYIDKGAAFAAARLDAAGPGGPAPAPPPPAPTGFGD
ncbi:cutinase family protein [Mycobacterium sherrisii]|uniref:Cutinase n=1 Tax=Mycobacterium sherrisii TaxID=243061 RepID=A0A1E3SH83_9MYCO|nr:cutinase family protein [Mycobacterium sherrisii]MCV7031414.1 cutinase family protein [Mycobacterium sherrisii]MEC4765314.1 cutinase family protein [Mycobacterium sherrisii]ODR01003.1 cutinase [Mycobacterium sherrisii]ORW71915.1 cutinase [Mycobacterium sherrisii]